MSKYRRKLLQSYYWRWKEIARFDTVETDATYTLSLDGYATLGFFIVGGGGGGRGDLFAAGHSGNGGNGGQVMHYQIPVVSGQDQVTITVGSGGERCEPYHRSGSDSQHGNYSNSGQASSVTYNGIMYLADGGNGGSNHENEYVDHQNIFQENSGSGGTAHYSGDNEFNRLTLMHNGREVFEYNGSMHYGSLGENGYRNCFDLNDVNLYGAGGGAGWNTHGSGYPKQYSPIKGGNNGGGTGGYGNANEPENTGTDATFYGGGGGGGSFSSLHKYGYGGAGYHGLIIIYGSVI